MDRETFLDAFRDSIRAITNSRYFSNERGYQGQLIVELQSRARHIFPSNVIWEQEYQKTLKNQGIKIRPDIIIHTPYDEKMHSNRRSGNFVVIQLKRRASVDRAREDFDNLNSMFKLDYQLGIFLNINSANTFSNCYTGDYPKRLHYFAVQLVNDEVVIYEQDKEAKAMGTKGRKNVKKPKKAKDKKQEAPKKK